MPAALHHKRPNGDRTPRSGFRFTLSGMFALTTFVALWLALYRLAGLGVVVMVVLLTVLGATLHHRTDRERLRVMEKEQKGEE